MSILTEMAKAAEGLAGYDPVTKLIVSQSVWNELIASMAGRSSTEVLAAHINGIRLNGIEVSIDPYLCEGQWAEESRRQTVLHAGDKTIVIPSARFNPMKWIESF